eukprot:10197695-Heterocapsa_arctica.AAC.1
MRVATTLASRCCGSSLTAHAVAAQADPWVCRAGGGAPPITWTPSEDARVTTSVRTLTDA